MHNLALEVRAQTGKRIVIMIDDRDFMSLLTSNWLTCEPTRPQPMTMIFID